MASAAALHVTQCGEGGAVTQWANCALLYVNAGRYRNGPSARYRNRFWLEGDALLMSWFPGRGHTVTSPVVSRLLTCNDALLLFCRRAPCQSYLLCGRLQAVATAQELGVEIAGETCSDGGRFSGGLLGLAIDDGVSLIISHAYHSTV